MTFIGRRRLRNAAKRCGVTECDRTVTMKVLCARPGESRAAGRPDQERLPILIDGNPSKDEACADWPQIFTSECHRPDFLRDHSAQGPTRALAEGNFSPPCFFAVDRVDQLRRGVLVGPLQNNLRTRAYDPALYASLTSSFEISRASHTCQPVIVALLGQPRSRQDDQVAHKF